MMKFFHGCCFLLTIIACGDSQKGLDDRPDRKAAIEKIVGAAEYNRLMGLSKYDFDQSANGFRQYSDNYELLRLLLPEYLAVNELSESQQSGLHWHLGQIHALNDNVEEAIAEMKQATYGPLFWKCYVEGSIAFLERDKAKLIESLELLKKQDNQMNIEFLEKFVKYFDRSYREAYSAEY